MQIENSSVPVFYMIQVSPDTLPQRIKFGWSGFLAERLQVHRYSWPNCVLVTTWPCPKHAERPAMLAITAHGCTRVSREVFDCADLAWTRAMADAYFAGLTLSEGGRRIRKVTDPARTGHVWQLPSGRWAGQVRLGRGLDGRKKKLCITADTEEEARRIMYEAATRP